MLNKLNIGRFAALVMFVSLAACQTTQPPEPMPVAAPAPAVVYVPEPVATPAPEPEPVYVEPDLRWLPGHSSYTTPVPVDPIDVDELGPVIPE